MTGRVERGMAAGYWMVRCCRRCPEVPARIWLCSHEPGEPDNLVDQPYMQGQIGLDLVDPHEIWTMCEFVEASPAEQAAMAAPPLSDRAPRNGRLPALQTAPMALWKQQRTRRITAAEYERQIARLRWAAATQADDPALSYRKPADIRQAAIPF